MKRVPHPALTHVGTVAVLSCVSTRIHNSSSSFVVLCSFLSLSLDLPPPPFLSLHQIQVAMRALGFDVKRQRFRASCENVTEDLSCLARTQQAESALAT